jgi:hypothetical protein
MSSLSQSVRISLVVSQSAWNPWRGRKSMGVYFCVAAGVAELGAMQFPAFWLLNMIDSRSLQAGAGYV